ncbi:alcohol oxidase [Hygrophoropsis aurantiaca]|uniref:Alcohol oxidase n=1 Tax=Hygrophoropsis aurantiaca TaxID=72124 RepID=A0ACB8A9D8_9AGAM|nr:alcohol oxidase [Hygrophoropsis aurantiaca]
MANWRLDETLTVEQALAAFAIPEESGGRVAALSISLSEDVSSIPNIEEYLLSCGLQRDGNDPFKADYIVIGGGTAGLAVASRLAENDPNILVVVVEAGYQRDNDPLIDVPGLYGMSVGNTQYDWAYKTVPQPNLDQREISSAAGKVLGGSSAINYMVRMRASSPEYDNWAKFGAGWDWKGLLPYFKKQESYQAPIWGTPQIFPGITKEQDNAARQQEPKFRGHAGPTSSTHNEIYTEVLEPTIKALNNLKIPTNRTPGYGNSTGIFNIATAVNRDTGRRSYAANTYRKLPKARNLIVLTGLCATKLLLKTESGSELVTGVQLVYSNPETSFPGSSELLASKEVILSAGAYNTPRLLELSGIGDPKVLKPLGIDAVIDLPGVGSNLQEHPFFISDFTVKKGVFTFDKLRIDSEYQAAQMAEYREKGTGAYATTVSAYGFITLDKFLTTAEIGDLKKKLDKLINEASSEFYKQQLQIRKDYLDHPGVGDVEIIMVPKAFATQPPKDDTSYMSLCTCIPHAVARGTVHITKNDALLPPAIDPQYLSNEVDTYILTKAAQFLRTISENAELKSYIDAPSSPPADVKTYEQWEAYVRAHTSTVQHPAGTAAMASKELGGVVDSKLLVYGTKNLRVVDMSIVPIHIAAHTLDTAYAIGEKAFAIIAGQDNA